MVAGGLPQWLTLRISRLRVGAAAFYRHLDAVVSPLIREKLLQTIDNFNLRALGNYTKFLN